MMIMITALSDMYILHCMISVHILRSCANSNTITILLYLLSVYAPMMILVAPLSDNVFSLHDIASYTEEWFKQFASTILRNPP